jgi:5-methylthioribose kinase
VILGRDRAKQFLPDIYLFDTSNMVFVMEFLGDCELLDHAMVATGEVPLEVIL